MGKFKIGDKVRFNYGFFPVEKTGTIKEYHMDMISRPYYHIECDEKFFPYVWESEITLIDRKSEEEKELLRLEHILEDPFGEETW